ncbi:glycosyltransferase family 2 protein [Pajaroellobacter abortibovis]|uniref:Glycosyltransferase 2-like domain-containing protein n=1 Tax=Pajaroellobacter abortibovis TaxID=1882918 RepID=A0A1L6MZ06_9BACT|nr:glycosyltransferase family 2 protein [Pajaroellobacter abortibovis]APS00752.1 hypothetical protein BCY86_08725 [Pajaroellobacter abortibovis]
MIDQSQIFVIIPTYNEAPRIGRVLARIPSYVDHVFVVNDASTDSTIAAVKSHESPRLKILHHTSNRGVGAAIITGYREALRTEGGKHDVLVVMAGDDQMKPEDMPRLIEPIAFQTADYVKGSRFAHPDLKCMMPITRRWGGLLFSSLTSLAMGQRISDSQCGYTAISRQACEQIDFETLWPGYGYPNDLLGQLLLRGLRICEVPVQPIYADEISRLRLYHLPAILFLIGRVWIRRQKISLPKRDRSTDGGPVGPKP